MQTFEQVMQWFLDLGSPVMLPIIFFVIGLFFRVKVGRAFKSALTIGVGFIGLNLVMGLLTDNLSPAAEAMVEKDRKSTRLNSSHVSISYAVFCLKKKIK